jgi:hypothetical protein
MDGLRSSRDGALETVRRLATMAEASGRDDLVTRLADVEARLADPAITVVVVGEFKQGKSSLINALLDTDVCATDDAVATAVPTFVRHSTEPSAEAIFGSATEPRFEALGLGDVATLTAEGDDAVERPSAVIVGVPSRTLEDGLVVVDTPGVGGLDSQHGVVTLETLARAEAVLFVSDASQELTATELDVLLAAKRRCGTVALVLTKVDINPAWRKIEQINRGHLDRAGIDVPVFPAAAPLQVVARATGDGDLAIESGFVDLVGYLRDELVARADTIAVSNAASALGEIADHLEARVTAERRGLEKGGARLVQALEEATARAERLRTAGGRWQVALEDGFTDLSSDLEHGLHTTFRRLLSDADKAIEKADPAQTWGELEPWLNRRLMADVMDSHSKLEDRVREVAADVASHLRLDEEEVALPIELDLARPKKVATLDISMSNFQRSNLGKEALSAVKGLRAGVVLFGVVAQVAGVALTGPATIAIGLVMGGKSLREERMRQVKLRKQKAKAAVKKCVDEVQVVVAKHTKDRVREAHRMLRDECTERAGVLQRSTQEALQAAQRAAGSDAAARAKRLPQLEQELEDLAQVRALVADLVP